MEAEDVGNHHGVGRPQPGVLHQRGRRHVAELAQGLDDARALVAGLVGEAREQDRNGLRVADEAVSVMDVLHFYVPTIDQVSNGLRLALNLIRKYLPEGAFSRIYLDEQPVDAGNYVAGALALESSDMNTAGFAMFKIKPKTNGVRMYWAQQAEKPMTAEELQSFNEAAVLEVDGQVVPTDKIRYSYKKSGWGCDATSELPTEPGTYVQTAEIGGNYSCSKISRNITVK